MKGVAKVACKDGGVAVERDAPKQLGALLVGTHSADHGRLAAAPRTHNKRRNARVAEAPQECPPLLRASRMGELGAIMNVKGTSLTIDCEKRPTLMFSSGHPALDVAEDMSCVFWKIQLMD